MEYTKWYLNNIEPEIREVVKILRDNGINTKGSCGHRMWVYCDWLDKEGINRAVNALRDAGYIGFYVNAQVYINLEGIPNCSIRIEFDRNKPIKRDDMPAKGIATENWRPID